MHFNLLKKNPYKKSSNHFYRQITFTYCIGSHHNINSGRVSMNFYVPRKFEENFFLQILLQLLPKKYLLLWEESSLLSHEHNSVPRDLLLFHFKSPKISQLEWERFNEKIKCQKQKILKSYFIEFILFKFFGFSDFLCITKWYNFPLFFFYPLFSISVSSVNMN